MIDPKAVATKAIHYLYAFNSLQRALTSKKPLSSSFSTHCIFKLIADSTVFSLGSIYLYWIFFHLASKLNAREVKLYQRSLCTKSESLGSMSCLAEKAEYCEERYAQELASNTAICACCHR